MYLNRSSAPGSKGKKKTGPAPGRVYRSKCNSPWEKLGDLTGVSSFWDPGVDFYPHLGLTEAVSFPFSAPFTRCLLLGQLTSPPYAA